MQRHVFCSISRRGVDADSLRRSTYTDDEYRRITRALISYKAKAEFLSEEERFTRQLVRHFFLIGANTMMRFGELYQLTWGNAETYPAEEQRLVTINVLAETSKVHQSRVIKVRGGRILTGCAASASTPSRVIGYSLLTTVSALHAMRCITTTHS